MRKRTWAIIGILTLSELCARQASAAASFSYAANAASFTGTPGSTVAVNLYLVETLSNGSNDLITPDGGLAGAGAAVNVTGTTGGTAAGIAGGSYAAASPFATTANTVAYDQGPGNNLEFTELTPIGGAAQPSNNQILLGTLDVTVGTGTTTYALSSLQDSTIVGGSGGEGDGNTDATNGTDLDAPGNPAFTGADAAPAFSFTVGPTATPEPACLSLLALGGLGLLRRSRE